VARALTAVGMAMTGDPALVWLGTGSVSYGGFAEALSLAAMHRAPVTFVVHWYTTPGPFAKQLAATPAALAQAMGLNAAIVAAGDVFAVRDAVRTLAAMGGPVLVQAELGGNA
jgi:TPP-dependent pyruvate/acetoin dehydrogenase alpha subunit